jgi:hypothetical protein
VIVEAGEAFAALDLAMAFRSIPGVISADPQLARHQERELISQAIRFPAQWYIQASDANGAWTASSSNILDAWDLGAGRGR